MDDIVITGYGIKAPGIVDKLSFLNVLKNGICTQSLLNISNQTQTNIVAGLIEDNFLMIKGQNYKRLSRSGRMAIAAALDAAEMANLGYFKPQRVAVIIGTSAGAILEIEQYSPDFHDIKTTPIQGVSYADTHTLSGSVAEAIGSCGPAFTLSTGCTASLDAVSMGKLLLESGTVDACIVGGTDAPLGQWTINGFKKLRALSTETSIENAGVPFSKTHRGFVLSEGAGVIVLECRQTAQARSQRIYGKIERVVSRNEGQKVLSSDTTGKHMLEVFQDALLDTRPSYVNSQALGLDANDQVERFILKETFGSDVPITSIKGMTGHSFGSMGAIQIISSLISMEYGFIPPTIKTKGIGFEDLPIVLETRYQTVESVCITSHGSSGNNACLLLTHF
ncbi:beta-ketoacyl synthase N-terminal-like domain-containing protein [Ureibacillus aquaedulcis]|uniref:Beta-ketoacyl synthase N-terminal-like domain-containing protein n=1 Tax=Ureibacillus aquaedulcis TaxID=3058421 RepID=A0ABT8GKL4_9BACL|nr:beta-ketoacyl synthase N-terminal-like domain-containing protein [Ureibacillus sp. BA0131]MDN4491957.1 beta-ketoacyl synthase N-terminal-like domain-containing protein [Ureibacillus sp. BA0131]